MNASVRNFFAVLTVFLCSLATVKAQAVEAVLGQITYGSADINVTSVSGDGRFVVFDSNGDYATAFDPVNGLRLRNNSDGNREVFLFDYAQRHIFQLTDTRSLLVSTTGSTTAQDNIRVDVRSFEGAISNDGRFIYLVSNATTANPTNSDGSNPSDFNPNLLAADSAAKTRLLADGNTEIWLYQMPNYAAADLQSGIAPAFVNLAAGTFTQITNTLPRPELTPRQGTGSVAPFISEDNIRPAANDDGAMLAFVSTSNLDPSVGNAAPDDNQEIFVRPRSAANGVFRQITRTTRNSSLNVTYNINPSLSGSGRRLVFISNDINPINGASNSGNADRNEEVFLAELNADGTPNTASGATRQVTNTTQQANTFTTNVLSYPGKRISRDGRYLAFESLGALDVTGSTYGSSFGTFIYDIDRALTSGEGSNVRFRQIGARVQSDTAIDPNIGDTFRYPSFTDYGTNADGTPSAPASLVFASRINIDRNGSVPATASDGMNSPAERLTQVYAYTISAGTFQRLTRVSSRSVVPRAGYFSAVAPLTTNTRQRVSFGMKGVDPLTGNFELAQQGFYLYTPPVASTNTTAVSFATGASSRPVATGSPTPTPTASPSPSPTTPPTVAGLTPNMVAAIRFAAPIAGFATTPLTANEADTRRRFDAPILLSGVSVSIDGAAARILYADSQNIVFVTPLGLSTGTNDVVINGNGIAVKTTVEIIPAQPDVLTTTPLQPGGRAQALNITNRVAQREPFTVTTERTRGGRRVATRVQVWVTGIARLPLGSVRVRVGSAGDIVPATITYAPRNQPGVYGVEFDLPASLNGAGDVPIVISVNGTVIYQSRLDDTAPRIRIL